MRSKKIIKTDKFKVKNNLHIVDKKREWGKRKRRVRRILQKRNIEKVKNNNKFFIYKNKQEESSGSKLSKSIDFKGFPCDVPMENGLGKMSIVFLSKKIKYYAHKTSPFVSVLVF